ncbi:16S rRNA (uracil(1498)-N(3))-methyltransferase [Aureimonas sp. AU12]|uniref:16S rRNA (uracil(1498)-N(3))-methyltransferase n=1 Tax=Aureimonas sp. AU12 TaxID=1638161 RepID=UPI0007855045|nr:16S rRNA (uracil(1498)-N(3))-methyltransferase [Aureimonas sp. AU12]
MPDYDFTGPRLFLDHRLEANAEIEASPAQANYLLNVLRLDEGAGLLLFNGRDGEWRAALRREGRKRLWLVPQGRTRDQTPLPDLHYCFAPLKSARLDYMVQKAVEMGAGLLQPVQMQHGQAPRFNRERAGANAVEAAEQCGILAVPECRDIVKLEPMLAGWDASRTLIFCDERAGAGDALAVLAPLRGAPLALLIGPEGGFAASERTLLLGLPFVRAVSLGPRILRADTAAVAALALVQAAAGDWTGA